MQLRLGIVSGVVPAKTTHGGIQTVTARTLSIEDGLRTTGCDTRIKTHLLVLMTGTLLVVHLVVGGHIRVRGQDHDLLHLGGIERMTFEDGRLESGLPIQTIGRRDGGWIKLDWCTYVYSCMFRPFLLSSRIVGYFA